MECFLTRSYYSSPPSRPSLVTFALFPITLLMLALISKPTTPAALYVVCTFLNGFCVGASLNYTLAHVLHLTLPETHFIVTSLLATFRGFAGSFGSAVGGGVFGRALKTSLEKGFAGRGMPGREDLVRRLMGSPALVAGLTGVEREVAIEGYVDALRSLFLAGVGLSVLMILVQAGTGWKAPSKVAGHEETQGQQANGHANLTR